MHAVDQLAQPRLAEFQQFARFFEALDVVPQRGRALGEGLVQFLDFTAAGFDEFRARMPVAVGEFARPFHQRPQRRGEAGQQQIHQQQRRRQRGGGHGATDENHVAHAAVERGVQRRFDAADLRAVNDHVRNQQRAGFPGTGKPARQPAARLGVAFMPVQQGAAILVNDADRGDRRIVNDPAHVTVEPGDVEVRDHAADRRFHQHHEFLRQLLLRFDMGPGRLARERQRHGDGDEQQQQGKGDGEAGAQRAWQQREPHHRRTTGKRRGKNPTGSHSPRAVSGR